MQINRPFFYNTIRRRPFTGSLTGGQVIGMEAILSCWEASSLTDMRWLAYCLATTFHETARTMEPIEEYGRGKGRAYGAPAGPWKLVYDGRGDVQLTWIDNYRKASAQLKAHGFDLDLEQHPDLAMKPDVAAAILIYGMVEGWFTGKKLADFFGDTSADPTSARKIINGTDQASTIAGYYFAFGAALTVAKEIPVLDAVLAPPPVAVGPHITGVVPAPAVKPTVWARLSSWFGSKAA